MNTRGSVALLLIVLAACQSTRIPVSKETRAELAGSRFVTLPRLAEELDLAYRGDGGGGRGVIELSAPPDHVMLVRDSRRALVNGTALSMGNPCMRRGEDLVVTSDDARTIRAALAAKRSERTVVPPLLPAPPPPGDRHNTLPAAWRPAHGVRERDWTHIVVHHMAAERGSAAVIDKLHRQRGWDGLGYHFVIGNGTLTGDGEVEVGYRWRRQLVGAHARASHGDPLRANNFWNEHAIGICLVGDFRKGPPSARQMDSLVRLIRTLRAEYRIPLDHVKPHRDVTHTLCPGPRFPWARLVDRLR